MSTTIKELFGFNDVKLGNPEKYFGKTPAVTEVVTSERPVGIEVEVENHSINTECRSGMWQLTQDGSLRNTGAEWITHPIKGVWAPYVLRELFTEVLSKECCFSPRTSVHVHVNCRDLTTEQVQDVILLYACIEPLYFKFAGRGRAKNIYCVPLVDTKLLEFSSHSKMEALIGTWSKYTGFNIVPLADKGTIEFRHMHGTNDHDKLTIWVRLITKLIDYVVGAGTSTIRKLVSGMDSGTNIDDLLIDIFGTDVNKFKYEAYDEIRPAVENAKVAFMAPKTYQALLNERNLKAAYFMTKGK
jgi:hypothetical protein